MRAIKIISFGFVAFSRGMIVFYRLSEKRSNHGSWPRGSDLTFPVRLWSLSSTESRITSTAAALLLHTVWLTLLRRDIYCLTLLHHEQDQKQVKRPRNIVHDFPRAVKGFWRNSRATAGSQVPPPQNNITVNNEKGLSVLFEMYSEFLALWSLRQLFISGFFCIVIENIYTEPFKCWFFHCNLEYCRK